MRLLTKQGNRDKARFPCFFVPLLLCSLFKPETSHAGAWTREREEFYFKATYSRFHSDKIFDPKGRRLSAPDFTDDSLYLYSEYGFTARWTGILSAGLKRLAFDAPGAARTVSGPADAWLFVKRSLLTAPLVVSAQAGTKVPLGYGTDRVPPLGQGQVDWEGRLLAGRSFHPFPAYAGAEFGYRRRNGPYSDELPYRLEAGLFFARNALFQLALDGVDNRLNDDAGDIATFATRPPNVFDQEYMKLRPALLFFLSRGFGLELAYESVLDGGNTAAGAGFAVSAAWQGRL